MGHPNDSFFYTKLSRFINNGLKCWNCVLATFQGKPFLPQEFGVKKIFEHNRFIQLAKNTFLLFAAWIMVEILFLNLLAKPLAHFIVADEIVFEADGS